MLDGVEELLEGGLNYGEEMVGNQSGMIYSNCSRKACDLKYSGT